MAKRQRPGTRAPLDPEDVLAGRVKPTADELLDLIHRINPTGLDLGARETELRYAQKARLQSLLVRRFAAELLVLPDLDHEGTVALRHRGHGRDTCHAVIATLDDDARAWTQLQLDLGAHLSEAPAKEALRPRPREPPHPEEEDDDAEDATPEALVRRAEEALRAYDYEGARRDLARALSASAGAKGPAAALLALLVETLGDDDAALTLEARLPAATLTDPKVRSPLALAAARSGDEGRALALLRGVEEEEAAAVFTALASGALACGDAERAESHLGQVKRRAPASPMIAGIADEIARGRALSREPAEAELEQLVAAGRDEEAEKKAGAVLARWPESETARRVLRMLEERRRRVEVERLAADAEAVLARGEAAIALSLFGRALAAAGRGPEREAIEQRLQAVEAAERERRAAASVERTCQLLAEPDAREGLLAYLELEEALRGCVRARSAREQLDDLDVIAEERAADRAKVEAVIALGQARVLAESDPEAALAALGPYKALLERAPSVRRIAREAEALARERRAAQARAEEAREAPSAEAAEKAYARLDAERLRDLWEPAQTPSPVLTLAAQGIAWKVAAIVVISLVAAGTKLVLARKLAPADVRGVMNTMIVADMCGILALPSLPRYLVVDEDDSAAGWHVLLLVAITLVPVIGVTLFLAAPLGVLIGATSSSLPRYLPWFGVSIALHHLGAVPGWLLAKKLRFRDFSLARVISEIGSTLACCVLAERGFGARAIVAGAIVRGALQLATFASLTERREWLSPVKLSLGKLWQILRFTAPLAGADLLAFGMRRWNAISIYNRYGLPVSQSFTAGMQLVSFSQVDAPLDEVLLAALAEEERRGRLRSRAALLRVLGLVALIFFPISAWLFAATEALMPIAFDIPWLGLGAAMMASAVMAPLRIFGATIGLYLQVRRRTVAVLLLTLLRCALTLGGILLVSTVDVTRPDASPFAMVILLGFGVYALASLTVITGTERVPGTALVRRLGPPLAACAVMAVAVRVASASLARGSVVSLALLVVIGLGVYAPAAWLLARAHVRELIALIEGRAKEAPPPKETAVTRPGGAGGSGCRPLRKRRAHRLRRGRPGEADRPCSDRAPTPALAHQGAVRRDGRSLHPEPQRASEALEGLVFPRSEGFEIPAVSRPELALDPGVTVLAYDQGEADEPFSVILHNRNRQPYTIAPRSRIARAVVVPVAVLRAFEEVRE